MDTAIRNELKYWPHAPLHMFNERGIYMVTAATLDRALLFKGE